MLTNWTAGYVKYFRPCAIGLNASRERRSGHVAQLKTAEHASDIPQFACREKYLKDNKHNGLH